MNDSGPSIDKEFEREKWLKEQEFRERDFSLKNREIAVKEGEFTLKQKELNRSLLIGPLNLAVIGATITGLANVWVSYHNGDAQRILEQSQAEHARIVGVVNGESAVAVDKLRFLLNTHLITEEPTRTNISKYIDQQPQKPMPPIFQSPASLNPPIATVSLDSPWLDGGHSQSEVCDELANQVRGQHQGRSVRAVSSSETNKKDFIGHVTYQYHCQFQVF